MKVKWSPWGLRLRFSRDISQKYSRYFGDGQPPVVFDWENWCVVGYHDFLKVTEFNRLTDLGSLSELEFEEDEFAPQRTHTDLILLSFDDSVDQDLVDRLCNPVVDFPLLMVCQMSLSPAAREFEGDRARLLQSMRVASQLLDSELPASVNTVQRAYFASLSGPDLVLVTLPRDASELWASHYLVRKAQGLSLACLEQRKLSDLDTAQANNWRGHAFGAVTPVLAFQGSDDALDVYRSDLFQEQELAAGLGHIFRLKVDCGHEATVLEDIRSACDGRVLFTPFGGSSVGERANWDSHTVEGYFQHIADLVSVWRKCLFSVDGGNWREQHLIDSFTVVSFERDFPDGPLPEFNHDQRAWTLTAEVRGQLDSIGSALGEFAASFLSTPQREELMSVFHMFCSCFYRQEFVGAARDLLPFFRQFASALSLREEWRDFLKRPETGVCSGETMWAYEEFSQQMDVCLSQLGRAVRNRMEHRSLQGDPPVPHTLSHGGCKLVNAYAVTGYLATEILLRPTANPDTYSRFAAAVCAGWNGRVVCQELFRDFRSHLEEQGGHRLSRLGVATSAGLGGWKARLLLLDISGKTLLRPSRCFVHCLHEAAEILEWIEQDRCAGLRKGLNEWVLGEVSAAFNDELVRTSFRQRGSDFTEEEDRFRQIRQDTLDFSCRYVVRSMCLAWLNSESEPRDVLPIERLAPTVFADFLLNAVKESSLFANDVITHVRESGGKITEVTAFCQTTALSDEFASSVDQVRELAMEITADTGMWIGLQHILYNEEATPDASTRLGDVAEVFRSLLVATSESCGDDRDRSRLEQSIIHRWAIQACANSVDDSWTDSVMEHVSIEANFHPEIVSTKMAAAYLERSMRNTAQFREDGGVAGVLRRLRAYGGQVQEPSLSTSFQDWETDILNAFRAAWRDTKAEDEIALVMELWQASERFGVARVLELAPE